MSNKQTLNARGLSWRAMWLCLILMTLAGCVEEAAVFSGLKPDYPPPLMAGCPTVTSLQPALRWHVFTARDVGESDSKISDVKYDLKIWVAAHGAPGNLVYAREGLPEPSHAVQEPLPPATAYFWSLRARFLLNGAPRVTDWGQQLERRIRARDPKPGELLGHDFIDHQYYRYYCFHTPKAVQ
jgi:hypothetical protein